MGECNSKYCVTNYNNPTRIPVDKTGTVGHLDNDHLNTGKHTNLIVITNDTQGSEPVEIINNPESIK